MERYQEIERSIIKTYRGRLWAPFIKAVKEYELIKPNDKICVCISGGKDSMLMAKLFQELKRHSDFEFEVKYLVMNPGYNEMNLNQIKKNIEILNIPAEIIDTDIFEIANNQEKNQCYLCAKMRRGALYKLAKNLGCNKIALGHHYDDVIETILMNMLNAGSFQTMLPKLHSDNYEGMELIRPLYLIRENDVKAWAKANDLRFIMCACRFTEASSVDGEINASKRLTTKLLIQELKKNYNQNVEKNIFSAASNVNMNKIIGFKKDGVKHSFLEEYDEEE
ncbi:MAG: tRNA 2-thiocytidine biosynthesis TtcA family protein [Anaeroplasma sp.]|uniref:tRNA 2-thiocytidine biosynthesis TtcA family protein n=1 Tax=Anaeroplasma sp. TaxID=1872523 RepID=UPI002A91F548|nr:tRNA 2-thiocytidine biosynthesis TtcA family protein [Anaeroplasma sp.]MDY5983656.1 tRNA 2-thiocytidine biosynthesis TtcA family protein [Anaeroplasma sp.]